MTYAKYCTQIDIDSMNLKKKKMNKSQNDKLISFKVDTRFCNFGIDIIIIS